MTHPNSQPQRRRKSRGHRRSTSQNSNNQSGFDSYDPYYDESADAIIVQDDTAGEAVGAFKLLSTRAERLIAFVLFGSFAILTICFGGVHEPVYLSIHLIVFAAVALLCCLAPRALRHAFRPEHSLSRLSVLNPPIP